MHEAGIAQAALGHVMEQVRLSGGRRPLRIVLRIGSLSGVDPEALRFAMEVLLPDSQAAGAELVLERSEALASCEACGADFSPTGPLLFECPACHALSSRLRRGRELDLVRIDFSNTP